MSDVQDYFIIPENAAKVLFAEDFVNHILFGLKLPLLSSGIADHRTSIYNAFSPQVRLAADYVYERLKEDMLLEHMSISVHDTAMNVHVFSKYVILLKNRTLERMYPIASGAETFMEYCVQISTLAAYFYQRGFMNGPLLAFLAIIHIIEDIDMVEEGGWDALNTLAADYAQLYIDSRRNYLTPESASDFDLLSPDSSSGGNSDASHSPDRDMCKNELTHESAADSDLSNSDSSSRGNLDDWRLPDHEIDGEDDQVEHPEKLTDDDICKMCIPAMSTLSGRPSSSNSICRHVEKTIDVIAENIASFSHNMSDSECYLHSFEESSSEDDTSKQKIRRKRRKKHSESNLQNSDSDTDEGETGMETTEYIAQFGRELTEKHSTILNTVVNELHESYSVHHFKASTSGNLTIEDISSSDDEDRVHSCA